MSLQNQKENVRRKAERYVIAAQQCSTLYTGECVRTYIHIEIKINSYKIIINVNLQSSEQAAVCVCLYVCACVWCEAFISQSVSLQRVCVLCVCMCTCTNMHVFVVYTLMLSASMCISSANLIFVFFTIYVRPSQCINQCNFAIAFAGGSTSGSHAQHSIASTTNTHTPTQMWTDTTLSRVQLGKLKTVFVDFYVHSQFVLNLFRCSPCAKLEIQACANFILFFI